MTETELRRRALGALAVGFGGAIADDRLRRAVADGLGCVVLFTRNIAGPDQLGALTASLRAERPDLLIAIDHEGGEFSHLSAVSDRPMPSPRTLGDLDDPELTRWCAREAGGTLARFGIDVMLAPSADVNNNPANPIISTRSFGTTPERVARHVGAFVAGVHDAGIAACAKHFPGHGDVTVDSHLDLPYVDRWAEEVVRTELPPFVAAIEAGVDLVMSAHIVFSDYDTVPATLSHRLLTGLLRNELGFTGVITTDALEMRGITATHPIPSAVVASIAAGADLAMVAIAEADPDALSTALVEAVHTGHLPEPRLHEAATRVTHLATTLTTRLTSNAAAPTGGVEVGDSVSEVARRVVGGQVVPELGSSAYVVDLAQPVHPAWRPYFSGLPDVFERDGVVIRSDDPGAVDAAMAAAAGRPLVVAVQDAVRTEWMSSALHRLLAGHTGPVAVLCTGLPEDRALVPTAVPAVVTGGRNPVVLRAVAARLTGTL